MKNYKIKIIHQKVENYKKCNLDIYQYNKLEILCFSFSPVFLPLFLGGTNEESIDLIIYDEHDNKKIRMLDIMIIKSKMYELYNIKGGKLYNYIEDLDDFAIIFDIKQEKNNFYIKKFSIIKN